MLPISDDNSMRRTKPYVNYLLILINVAVFLYQISLPSADLDQFISKWSAIPYNISHGQSWITLVTSMFLHGGWLHIGGNMLYLWIFGDNVEDAFGHIGYLIFYLVCGIIAGLAQVLVGPDSQTLGLGASGAIAGVLGAYIIFFPRAQVNTLIFLGIFFFFQRLSAILVIGVWAVLQFFSGFSSISSYGASTSRDGVAYFAHIGGFVAGVLIALATKPFINIPSPYVRRFPPGYSPNNYPPGWYR